jgi:hypothetical protein
MAQYGLRIWQGKTHPHPIEYVIWLGGLALTLATTTALARIALRVLAEAEKAARKGEFPDASEMASPERASVEADA